jgi:histidyl-tRNA synthetase
MTNKINPQTLKGFRDFLPKEAIMRECVTGKIRQVFERFGFDPLETPALEYAETLLGKYGEEANKLLYLFEDRGGRKIGLRYDQTVPLARVVAQYRSLLVFPFKRYQIQPVWRAESPQKGRFREFMQCDIDIAGAPGVEADAQIIVCAMAVLKSLGFKIIRMLINDRASFGDLPPKFITAIDKLPKVGKDKVIDELIGKGMDRNQAEELVTSIGKKKPTPLIEELFEILTDQGLLENKDFAYSPTLARGLDYYTGAIYELVCDDYTGGSLGGGGRYDKLIGQFTGEDLPATGFAFGFDRLIEAIKELKLFPDIKTATQVLVTVFSPQLLPVSLKTATLLRDSGINTDIYLDKEVKLDRQLKYADRKGIPYVIIIGPEEAENDQVKVKNMKTGDQKTVANKDIVSFFKKIE